MGNPVQTSVWQALQNQAGQTGESYIGLMKADKTGVSIDFSRSFMPQNIWQTLIALARQQEVEKWRDKMVAGEAINHTENRAVGHMRLRADKDEEVLSILNNMRSFVEKTHAENDFTDVVHIGIGGSDLGPRLICDALSHLPPKLKTHFVANVDAADIALTLRSLNPDTTLFIIASKTFTTQETMMNAAYAKAWLGDRSIAQHMIALSTNRDAVEAFGIDPDNMFPFWDWVGGRFSVWSAIGMPIALSYGFDIFEEFLSGARDMDEHFMQAPLAQNLPILLALYGIWNRNFMHRNALAVLPYAQNLALLPNFLQQLDMESNGKSVDRDGHFITDYATGPIIFGQAGTNGQHAFHQWLHQGAEIVPCEFITFDTSPFDESHHQVLNAHATAQADAFANGDNNQAEPHKHYAGGRPSITVTLKDLSPALIGALIALYEHKILVQGVVWNINSFDQFGVELGKKLASKILTQSQ
jgi:glucose-6-phosphate isomerase